MVRKREKFIAESGKSKEELANERSYMFSNLSRPKTGFKLTDSFRRPLSTKDGAEVMMAKRREL